MKDFTGYLLTMMVIVLSSIVMPAQPLISSKGGKNQALPLSRAVLYEQTNPAGSGQASRDFEEDFDAYDCQGADDFIIPPGFFWNIETVTVSGTGSTTATLVHVFIYDDVAGMPADVETTAFMGLTCTNASSVLTVSLPGGLLLGSGHYWISVQDASPYETDGQWFWSRTASIYNSGSCWRNPGDGFESGAINWTTLADLGYLNSDFMFRLEGTVGAPVSCDYQVALYDTYGDGWNGGSLNVFVDGVQELFNVTLPSGSGPAYYSFPVTSGASITTTYVPGGWPYENWYQVLNSQGVVVYQDGDNTYTAPPVGIGPGLLYASCPLQGDVEGHVSDYNSLPIAGATVYVIGGTPTITDATGYYILTDLIAGDVDVYCERTGYNPAMATVTIIAFDTITQNFTLTNPTMEVQPLIVDYTLNPNEYLTFDMSVINNGNGPLHWSAIITEIGDKGATDTAISVPETDNVPAGTVIEGLQASIYTPGENSSIGPGNGRVLGEDGSRDLMLCPDGSIFSIPPVGSNNGWNSTLGTGYKCSQSFSGVTDVIYNVTFWAIYTSAPPAAPTFKVDLCLPGSSSTPGAVVTTYTTAITAVNTGVMVLGYQTYVFTVEVPPTALEAGWVSVQQQTTSPTFYWLNTMAGASFPAYLEGYGPLPDRVALCLGGAAVDWLTMDRYEGNVAPFGGTDNIPAHLDATGKEAEQIYTAEIVFASDPDVGTIIVPVTMTVAGDTLDMVSNLTVGLVNDLIGEVLVNWDCDVNRALQYFAVNRDGFLVGTTTETIFTDTLPDYGIYCYTVQAVYDEGQTVPTGPECLEWMDCNDPINYGNVNDPALWATLVSGESHWYSFTSPYNVLTTVSLCGTYIDTKLEIYTSCETDPSFYNDDFECPNYSYASQISNIPVLAGETWYARVYGKELSTSGPITISVYGFPEPANDDCETAQFISGPYPQVINGTTIGAFPDCPVYLDWKAVWYEIDLPYTLNRLSIDFCGTAGYIPSLGYYYYNNCSDCSAYNEMDSYVFSWCSDGYYNPQLEENNIPGPATIFFPAYVGNEGMDFTFTVDVRSYGDLDGNVTDYSGAAIEGATITIEDIGWATTTDPTGYYYFPDVPDGLHAVTCTKTGHNPVTADITIIANSQVTHDFTLLHPTMEVQPLIIDYTLNPNEYFTFDMSVTNNGTGPLDWDANIELPEENPVNHLQANHPEPAPKGKISNSVTLPGSFLANDGQKQPLGNRELLVCPEESFFSYPVDIDNAYTAYPSELMEGTPYKIYQKVIGLTENVGKITFWGLPITCCYSYCSGEDPVNFLVEFWEDGSTPGANLASFLVTANVIYVGDLWGYYPMYEYTVEFPNVDMTTGWISIEGQVAGSGTDCTFFWVLAQTNYGTTLQWNGSYYDDITSYYNVSMSLCLSSGPAAGWLTMDYDDGTIQPFGGTSNIPTHLDATGKEAGQVYTGEIIFTSDPDVGTITIPVTMTISGDPLDTAYNLTVALVDDLTGEVAVNWDWSGSRAFQYFIVNRDGTVVGTTAETTFTDILPDYGTYCYTVQAVYDEGQTAPIGPECLDWNAPGVIVLPDNLDGEVLAGGHENGVSTLVSNIGESTLAFSFPLFAAMDLLNNPEIGKNRPGAPFDLRSGEEAKGEDQYADQGYPVVLGAGGPDSYGYSWIDSDEPGGPACNWMDISATGISVSVSSLGDDGMVGPFPMGFTFPFYGVNKTEFYIASNGAVSFRPATSFAYSNTSIPTNNTTTNDFIALFWDDLYSAYTGCAVYYQNFADYTIVQYDNTSRLSYSAYTMDMQVIIYRNGSIKVQYKDITDGFNLASATVGLQSSVPSVGLQVAYNTSYVHNNLAIFFSSGIPADFITDVEPAFGTILPEYGIEITITYNSLAYDPGYYTQELLMETNVPGNGEYIISNRMLVLFDNGIYTWEGDISPWWTDPGNWNKNAVPDSLHTAIIPKVLINTPVVNNNFKVNKLFIYPGGELLIDTDKYLTVKDSLFMFQTSSDTSRLRIRGNLKLNNE